MKKPDDKNKEKSAETGVATIPTNTENDKGGDVYKEREFARFCLWLSMPTMFRGEAKEELEKKYFIDDEEVQELCAIKTMGQFAETYGIHRDTLTDWKVKAKNTDLFRYVQAWAKTVSKNVVASAYRSAMSKDPKAFQDRKLMLQLTGWSEEQTVNVKGEGLFDILKKGLNIQ